ncbi:restriction endonuclease subunit S [Gephyromycinifex aptenodytis]|uniref:restriction endonuclease subunit S n=1 Tax=Gephyromycinifex aptenodytis TaxID=2716227 RepID=UPI001444D6CB|nr:restriction endonuclease subunit S [Gephyromycinifex aptenodytis]
MTAIAGWDSTSVADEFHVQLGKRLDAAVKRGKIKACINNRSVRWGHILIEESVWEPLTDQDIRGLRLIAGDVLMCEGGEIGRAAVWNNQLPEAYFLNTLHRLRSKGGYDPYLLTSFFERIAVTGGLAAVVGKATLAHLTKENLLNVRLPLPPTDEQLRIVAALRSVGDLIATLERLIAKKQAIKQGMMQQLLTGRTRLPGFADEWTDIRLGDHVSYVKTVALSRDQLDAKSPLRYLHYGDIHTRSSVLLDTATEEMPRASALLAGRAGRLRRGDLIFADASEDPAGVGKSVEIVNVPSGGAVPGLHTIAARFDKSILSDGFKAYLQFIPSFRDQLLRLAAGTKVLATTRSYISSITLTLPDIAEQKAIAEVLHDSEREIDSLRVRLSKAREMKIGMMQQLLTGRTRLPVEATS